METEQPSSNQSLMETETQSQQVSSDNNKLFVVVTISVLLTAMIIGLAVYFWQKSAREKAISGLEQKISSLEKQISAMKKVETIPQPTSLPVLSPTPTTDPIINWKTYVDDELKYSIKYPQEFDFSEKNQNANYITIRKPGGEVEGTGAFSHFRISIEKGPEADSLENAITHLQQQTKQIVGDNLQFTPIISSDINNVRSMYYYHEGPIGYQQHIVLLDKNKSIIHISVIFSNKTTQENEQHEVDQILSTFDFTN